MDQLLVGALLAILGLPLCFLGLRFWFILLPAFGGVVGFSIGAMAVQELLGAGFLSTGISWIAGLVLGIGLALLSWYIWFTGVIILAAAAGAILASGLMHAAFDDPSGWAVLAAAAVAAIVCGLLATTLHLPSYLVIAASAVAGAALIVAGALTMFGTVAVSDLANGVAIAIVDDTNEGTSWLGVLSWLVLAVAGITFQMQHIAATTLPQQRWMRAHAGYVPGV